MHKKIFVLFILLGLSICLAGCSSFLYYPTKLKYVNEKVLDVPPQEVLITADKDTSAYAWYFTNKKNQNKLPTVLFFHGNGQNRTAHFQSLYWILEHKLNLLVIDYPGYGNSPGAPTPKNTVQIGKAAISWLKKNDPDSKVAIYAQSLGGPIALRSVIDTQPDFKPCQITIEASFDSYQDVARDALSRNWFTWIFQPLAYVLLSDNYSPEGKLSQLDGLHTFVMHAKDDPVVSVKFGQRLYKDLGEPKELFILDSSRHINAFHGNQKDLVRQKYLSLMDQYCR